MKTLTALLTSMLLVAAPVAAKETSPRPDQLAFRDIYKELVETNTTLSSGSCTLAAERMAARLKTAGFGDDQLTLFADPDHPKEGGLVAVYPGTSKTAKPILLIAHIDVVEAKRADWERDPFKMVEENGYFYGRGTADDKAQAAVWVDTLIRFKQAGYKPKRSVKVALTCGEETNGAFNGAEWLAANKRDLIDAEFALNEGGGGDSDGKGHVIGQSVQVGEKTFANFRLETRNPGGHSSVPVRDNAIYQLARALTKIDEYEFPVEMTDTTRRFFSEAGAARGDEMGKAMAALAADPADKAAEAIVNKDRFLHGNIRTTCVATLLDGGHAPNALPQRAGANINCRIFPGVPVEAVRAELERVIADPAVAVKPDPDASASDASPLRPDVMAAVTKAVHGRFPGLPIIPSMSAGATDSYHFRMLGVPSYGVAGLFSKASDSYAHGLNERVPVNAIPGALAHWDSLLRDLSK